MSFINWMVNSPEAANINLAERGIPANKEMLAAHRAQAVQGAAGGFEVHRGNQEGHHYRYTDCPAAWRWHPVSGPAPLLH